MRLVAGLIASIFAASLPAVAGASPVNARISQGGLNFLRDRAVEMVPSHMEPDPIEVELFQCDEGPAMLHLNQPKLDISLNALDITLPGSGVIRVNVNVSVAASGSAYFERIFACYGRETCQAAVSAKNARATIDLAPSIDAQGKPHVELKKVDVQLEPDDVSIELSGCPEDDLINGIVGFVKNFGLKLGVIIGENIAQKQVGPMIEGMLANYLTFSDEAMLPDPLNIALDFKASLVGLDISTTGLQIRGDVDLTSKFPAASCLPADPGEPSVIAGAAPDLGAGTQSMIGVAVNFGLIQDALYHLWHEGLLCLRPDSLPADMQATLKAQLGQLGNMLPGFPEGTTFTFEGKVMEPPRVEGNVASQAKLTVHIDNLDAQIIATLPDRSSKYLGLRLDASVTASVVMDPRINALSLQVDGVKLDKLDIDDHFGLDALGFDFGRLRQMVEEQLLPDVLSQVGQIPITGPVFGGIPNVPVYVILKELKTTPAYLTAKADLFKAPDNDKTAPTTSIDQKPAKIVRPAEAKLMFGGKDKEVPTELLRYRVLVDGKAVYPEPSFVRLLQVGTAGKSGTVKVEVHAVDLAGNEDRTGVKVDIDTDGVMPTLQLKSQLRGEVDSLTPSFSWDMNDDRTAKESMQVKVVVTQIPDQPGQGAEMEISNKTLSAGATSAQLDGLQLGKQYKVTLTVADEAGNAVSSDQIFSVASDASGAGGCSVGHGQRGSLAGLILLAGLALVVRRRRAA